MDIELDVLRGRVVGFRLNYRAFLGESWREVVRYDTDHGRLHMHRFWLDAGDRVMDLEDARNPASDYRGQFTQAIADVSAKWRLYRSRTERKWQRN